MVTEFFYTDAIDKFSFAEIQLEVICMMRRKTSTKWKYKSLILNLDLLVFPT